MLAYPGGWPQCGHNLSFPWMWGPGPPLLIGGGKSSGFFSLQGSDSSLQSKKIEIFLINILYLIYLCNTDIFLIQHNFNRLWRHKDPSGWTEPQNNSRPVDIACCHRCVTPLSPPFLKVGTTENENLLYQPTGFSNMSLHHRYGEDESNLHCPEAAETALAHLAPFTTSKLAWLSTSFLFNKIVLCWVHLPVYCEKYLSVKTKAGNFCHKSNLHTGTNVHSCLFVF